MQKKSPSYNLENQGQLEIDHQADLQQSHKSHRMAYCMIILIFFTVVYFSLQELTLTLFEFLPNLANLSISLFLTDFSIALKSYNQAHPFGESFKILMKSQSLWRPIIAAIARVGLHGRANALLFVVKIRSLAAGLGTGWGNGVAQFELEVGEV